ncbi:nucleoside/nucleotide kinase family protein [Kineococcus arenarius]|uniref:dephospho-CoA kinase n=1 Tax=unclassified Kineococcus TaxID=2621656 RepID=UPI003D7F06B1
MPGSPEVPAGGTPGGHAPGTGALDAGAVLELLAARVAGPAPGAGPRVVAVDGRSGSGKTHLAELLGARTGAPVLHLDELYPGWDGLEAGVRLLEREVLVPLREGRAASPPRWDWAAGRRGPRVPVPVAPVLVVEGVGAGCTRVRPQLLVWVGAGERVRRQRALQRDGEVFAPHWHRWAAQERALFARCDARAAADVVLSSDPPAAPPGGSAATGVRWRVLRG